jgi:hypothetical protein
MAGIIAMEQRRSQAPYPTLFTKTVKKMGSRRRPAHRDKKTAMNGAQLLKTLDGSWD